MLLMSDFLAVSQVDFTAAMQIKLTYGESYALIEDYVLVQGFLTLSVSST